MKGTPNKDTQEKVLRAQLAQQLISGRMLAVDVLRVGMHLALEGMMYYAPFNQDGTIKAGAATDTFIRWSELAKDYARHLAPFESPKLSSITLPQAPRVDQDVSVRVNIFNDRGERLAEIVDGKELELIEQGSAGCCARATSGHAAAVPPTSPMKLASS